MESMPTEHGLCGGLYGPKPNTFSISTLPSHDELSFYAEAFPTLSEYSSMQESQMLIDDDVSPMQPDDNSEQRSSAHAQDDSSHQITEQTQPSRAHIQ